MGDEKKRRLITTALKNKLKKNSMALIAKKDIKA
jgi:hypothetical protein